MEQWRPVIDYEDSYEVSDHGNVRSLDRELLTAQGVRKVKGRQLRLTPTHGGHLTCRFGLKEKRVLVHLLVMHAFVGPKPAGMVTRHLNGNPADNRVENLAYGTWRENVQDRKYHKGQRNRLSLEAARELKRRIIAKESPIALAREFGVTTTTIHGIKTGRIHDDVN